MQLSEAGLAKAREIDQLRQRNLHHGPNLHEVITAYLEAGFTEEREIKPARGKAPAKETGRVRLVGEWQDGS